VDEHLDPVPDAGRHRIAHLLGDGEDVVVEADGALVEEPGGALVRGPDVVLGGDHLRPAPAGEGAHHEAGLGGDEGGVEVDDVHLPCRSYVAQPPPPPDVPRPAAVEAVGRDAGGIEVGDEVVLPRQQVGGVELETGVVGVLGERQQQALGTTRAEALGQPQHLGPSAAPHSAMMVHG